MEYEFKKYYESPCKLDYNSNYGSAKLTIKMKESCQVTYSENVSPNGKNYESVSSGDTITIENNKVSSNFQFICFGQTVFYSRPDMPDIIILAPYAED